MYDEPQRVRAIPQLSSDTKINTIVRCSRIRCMDIFPLIICMLRRLAVSGRSRIHQRIQGGGGAGGMSDWREYDVFVWQAWLENLAALLPFSVPQAQRRVGYGLYTHTQETAQERLARFPQVPMATNGGIFGQTVVPVRSARGWPHAVLPSSDIFLKLQTKLSWWHKVT